MKANLLIVSVDEFPPQVSHYLSKHGFTCYYSRGGMKTKEILKTEDIDAIIWLFLGHEKALAMDLLEIFNLHQEIPVIFLTRSYDELDFADEIKGLYANLDLNDDTDDLLKNVETACNQSLIEEKAEKNTEPILPEIGFKNVVAQIFQESGLEEEAQPNSDPMSIQQTVLLNAVDQKEKELLSAQFQPEKKPFFSKIKDLFS